MDPVSNYKLQCTQAEAMVQDYYNNVPPFTHSPALVPIVPCENQGNITFAITAVCREPA